MFGHVFGASWCRRGVGGGGERVNQYRTEVKVDEDGV